MEIVTLSEVCEFLDNMRKPITAKDRIDGPYPYYGANGVLGYINDYLFDEELVLLAEDGGFFDDPKRGIAYRVSGKCWVNNHAHVLRPKSNIDVDYLGYALYQYEVRPFITGAIIKKLTQKAARHLPIPLPSLEEQKRIVRELDAADALRQKRKQAIALLDDYLKAVFLEMFGDPVTNPKKWEKKKFADLGTLDRGISKHRPRNAPKLLGGAHPLIQTGDVANAGMFIKDFHATYSDLGLSQSRKWQKGTLCITIAANIAKTGILTFDACFPDSVVGFIPDPKKTNNVFMHFWMSFFQKILEANAPESAQKNINLKILRALDVIIPPIEIQNEFANAVRKIELIREKMNIQADQMESNFNALLQRAFDPQRSLQTVKVPVKSRKEYTFGLLQAVGAIIESFGKTRVQYGEMVTAKFAYLLQEVFKVPLGISFQKQSFGPYDSDIKKAIEAGIKQKYFAKNSNGALILGAKGNTLLGKNYSLIEQSSKAMEELMKVFKNAPSHKIELLATICKAIQDAKNADFEVVNTELENWATPAQITATKAEKFSNEEVKKCLEFIKKQGWNKLLIK